MKSMSIEYTTFMFVTVQILWHLQLYVKLQYVSEKKKRSKINKRKYEMENLVYILKLI